jgi:hypothetical protein
VVLGYDVWQRQFLHDPAIIGRVVTLGRTARTVVGVMPPRFGFPHDQQAWVALPVQDAPPRQGPAVRVFGRLADGASSQDVAAELEVVSARIAADQPATHAQLRTRVRAFAGRTPGDPLRLEDWLIHAIVLLVRAAVSANVATLIFARTAMRESEIVVRHALGASRSRVIAQIVTESLVLTLAAVLLGLVVAQTTVRYAWTRATLITGESLPFWVDLTLEPASIAYALLLAIVAAALIGVLPALKATGVSVQRGLLGITSTGGTMKFGRICLESHRRQGRRPNRGRRANRTACEAESGPRVSCDSGRVRPATAHGMARRHAARTLRGRARLRARTASKRPRRVQHARAVHGFAGAAHRPDASEYAAGVRRIR